MAVIKNGHPLFMDVIVLDSMGNKVNFVSKYNTRTKVATVHLGATTRYGLSRVVVDTGVAKTVNVKLPGSRLVHKKTYKDVKASEL